MIYALLKIPTHHLIYSWIVYSGLFSQLEDPAVTAAVIDGNGPGWHLMTSKDFVDVNTESNHCSERTIKKVSWIDQPPTGPN